MTRARRKVPRSAKEPRIGLKKEGSCVKTAREAACTRLKPSLPMIRGSSGASRAVKTSWMKWAPDMTSTGPVWKSPLPGAFPCSASPPPALTPRTARPRPPR